MVSRIRSNRCLRLTGIYMIAQSVPLQTKGHTYAMCIYTVGRRPLLSPSEHHIKFCEFRRVRRKRRERLSYYDRPSHGLSFSQRLIASHPQQDNCKSNKKNWDLQETFRFSCKSQFFFVLLQLSCCGWLAMSRWLGKSPWLVPS